MTEPYETQGYYGGSHISCTVYVYRIMGVKWYAAEGATGVNATTDDIDLGVDIETLNDCEFFTADNPIKSTDDLMREVDDLLYG